MFDHKSNNFKSYLDVNQMLHVKRVPLISHPTTIDFYSEKNVQIIYSSYTLKHWFDCCEERHISRFCFWFFASLAVLSVASHTSWAQTLALWDTFPASHTQQAPNSETGSSHHCQLKNITLTLNIWFPKHFFSREYVSCTIFTTLMSKYLFIETALVEENKFTPTCLGCHMKYICVSIRW